MSNGKETFIEDFTPLITECAVECGVIDYFDALEIPRQSYPAPTLNGNKAAYWLGSAVNDDTVLPIIAISLPVHASRFYFGPFWSVGAARLCDIAWQEDYLRSRGLSERPFAAAVLELAVAGPYVHFEAFENIRMLCPVPKGLKRN